MKYKILKIYFLDSITKTTQNNFKIVNIRLKLSMLKILLNYLKIFIKVKRREIVNNVKIQNVQYAYNHSNKQMKYVN